MQQINTIIESNNFINPSNNEIIKYKFRNKYYDKCPEGTENSKNKEFFCEIKCTKEYPFEIILNQTCIHYCSINDRLKGLCKLNYIDNSENNKSKDELLEQIKIMITKDLNMSNFNNITNYILFKDNNVQYSLSSTNNNRKYEKINNTEIDLGDCEMKLKEKYIIPEEKSLYIFKVEIFIDGMKIPKVEYEVYYPLNGSNLELLNLSVCSNKVELSYPIKIDEKKIDQFDYTSAYYNDLCYTTTTEKGTDIILKDKRDEYLKYNLTICEEECDFKLYNDTLEKVTCSCKIKIKIGSLFEIKFDKLKLYRRFTHIYSISNFDVMKCSHLVFNKNIISKNIGFYLISSIIIFGVVSLGIFYFKEYNTTKANINVIILQKKEKENLQKKLNEEIALENKTKNKDKIKRHQKRMSVLERNRINFLDNGESFTKLMDDS